MRMANGGFKCGASPPQVLTDKCQNQSELEAFLRILTRSLRAAAPRWRSAPDGSRLRRAVASAPRNAPSGNSTRETRRCPDFLPVAREASDYPWLPVLRASGWLWRFAGFGRTQCNSASLDPNRKATAPRVPPALFQPGPIEPEDTPASAEPATRVAPCARPVPARRHGFALAKLPPVRCSPARSVLREVSLLPQVGPVQLPPAVVQSEPSGLAMARAPLQEPSQVHAGGSGRLAFRAFAASPALAGPLQPWQAPLLWRPPLPNPASLRPALLSLQSYQAGLRSARRRPPLRLRVRAIRMREPPAPGRRDEPAMWGELGVWDGKVQAHSPPQPLQPPLRERLRLCSLRPIPRAPRPSAGAPAPPPPWSSTATCGIVLPPPCTNARLRHARRPSRATAPIQMPPWHRACARRVLRVVPPRRCPLSLCGYALGSVANRPWPSIVAASGACGQNLNGRPGPLLGFGTTVGDDLRLTPAGLRRSFVRRI